MKFIMIDYHIGAIYGKDGKYALDRKKLNGIRSVLMGEWRNW